MLLYCFSYLRSSIYLGGFSLAYQVKPEYSKLSKPFQATDILGAAFQAA